MDRTGSIFSLSLLLALGGCSQSVTPSQPSETVARADQTDSDDERAPLLECEGTGRAGRTGSLAIYDEGPAEVVPEDLEWHTRGLVREGIALHRYRVTGSYALAGGDDEASEPSALDGEYVGRLFLGDGQIFSSEDAFQFGLAPYGEMAAILTVVIEPGLHGNIAFNCEGTLPTAEEVTPVHPTTHLTCKTNAPGQGEENEYGGWIGETTIQFAIESLDDPTTMDLVWPESDEDEISAVAVTPEDSPARTLVSGIYNGYVEYLPGPEQNEGRLRMWSDDDGFEFGELILYENSGYRAGYVKITSGLDGSSSGSDLRCER